MAEAAVEQALKRLAELEKKLKGVQGAQRDEG